MLRSVFTTDMWSRRKAMMWWTGGTFVYLLMIGSVFPTVQDNAEQFDDFIDNYPEALKEILGMSGDLSYSSGDGFLQIQLFSFLVPLLLLIFTVGVGSRAVAGEEEDGTLDLLLSGPITRRSVVAQKLGAMVVLSFTLGAAMFAAVLLAGALFGLEVPAANIAAAVLSSVLLALTFGALALAVGAATGRRAVTIGVASGVALAAYLVFSLGGLVDALETVERLSPWYYYGAAEPVRHGVEWAHAGVLAALIVALGVGADFAFRRRDVGV